MILGGLGIAALLAGWSWPMVQGAFSSGPAVDLSALVLETVKRGEFRVTVTERGTVDSRKNRTLLSKVEGATTIIRLAPEGSYVKAGDVVCELDSSALKDKETAQRILVTQAESQLTQAKENVEIQKTQNDSDIAAAKLKLKLAEIDLKKFQEGDFLQQQSELDGQKTVASENLNKALEEFEFANRLAKKGYGTQNELEAKRIAVMKSRIDLSVATDKLKVLQQFSYERSNEELQANAREFARELERTERKALAALAQKESELTSRQLTYEVEEAKLQRLREQIANCTLIAPSDGQVIYVNTRDGRPADTILIEEGATVRERQAIINLPDLDQMKVNARIHESRISMVKPGQRVTVRVDAYPNETFDGEVDTVSSVPSSTNSFIRDVKEYDAFIKLLGDSSKINRLRPGLTAGIEILVEQRDNVLMAPIQAIVMVGPKYLAFVVREDRIADVEVKVGVTNDRSIEIIDGLKEGDRVVMNPRSHFSKIIAELEAAAVKAAREAQAQGETAKAPATPGAPPAPGAGTAPGAGGPTGPNGTVPRQPGDQPRRSPGEGGPPGGGAGFDPQAFFQRMDADGDGRVTLEEAPERMRDRFATLDANGDGGITAEEFAAAPRPAGGPGGGAGRGPGAGAQP